MADSNQLRETIENAVLAALEENLPALRDQIIKSVLQTVTASAPEPVATTTTLNAALASIHERGSQAEILATMLDGVAQFSGRVALFVVRGAVAQGWQARGLAHNDGIKAFSLDANAPGLTRRASETRAPVYGSMAEFDPRIAAGLGAPVAGNALVLPLVVRNKVAGIVYADAGTQAPGRLDGGAIEILVRAAASWIEVSSVRKASGIAGESPVAKAAAAAAGPAETPAAPVVVRPEPVISELGSRAERAAEAQVPLQPPVEPTPPAVSQMKAAAIAPQDEETHRKARRFAKLLVEEIKLYNEAKVMDGRQKRNLYGLLKDDIEKSRASYDKRYGQTAAASSDYFTQELIRILADGNESLLGGSFSR